MFNESNYALKYSLVESKMSYCRFVPAPVIESDQISITVDITVPHDKNIVKTKKHKQFEYLDLAHGVVNIWDVDSEIIMPLVASGNGLIDKSLEQYLRRLALVDGSEA